jgi:hypothetical protein
MVFSKAEIYLKSPTLTPLPTPRMSLPATVCSLLQEPDQEPDQTVSAPIPPTIMEVAHATLEELIELSSSLSSVSSSLSGKLMDLQTQKMQRTDNESTDSKAILC